MVADALHARQSAVRMAGAAGVLAAASWGLAAILTKSALEHIAPFPVLITQLGVSALALWGVVAVQRQRLPAVRKTLIASLPGVLQPGLAYSFGYLGLALTTVSVDTVLWSTEALMTLTLAGLLLRERVSRVFVALSLVAFVGVLLVVAPQSPVMGGGRPLAILGDGLIVLGVACASFYTIRTSRLVATTNPILLTALHQTSGLIFVCVVWRISGALGAPLGVHTFDGASAGVWIVVAVSGIAQNALPFGLYLYMLRHLPAARASLYLELIPGFAFLGAYIWLGERFNSIQWIGTLVTLLAVAALSHSTSGRTTREAVKSDSPTPYKRGLQAPR